MLIKRDRLSWSLQVNGGGINKKTIKMLGTTSQIVEVTDIVE
jgi:hypothetical protein